MSAGVLEEPAISNALPDRKLGSEWSAGSRRGLTVCFCLLLALLALPFDLSISRHVHTLQSWKALHQPLQVIEAFGDTAGVVLLVVTIWIVAPEFRGRLWRLCGAVLSAGLVVNLAKFSIARVRPRSYPNLLTVDSIQQSWLGWWPLFRPWQDLTAAADLPLKSWSQIQSFPSGHSATGFALAVALTHLWPRGGWWFFSLATAIAIQRIETGAHFVSDTCCGAAVGLLVAWSWCRGTPWARWADRLEQRPANGTLAPSDSPRELNE